MSTGLAKKAKYTVAVIGATGVVGRESLEILEERRFPLEKLRLFASRRSAGEGPSCPGRQGAGVVVIDDSAVFRMDADVPLVVPEVNAHALDSARRRIIAIPNCTTAPLVMVQKPLHEAATIKRVVVTTFQSVSGTGAAAMAELLEQTKALLSFKEVKAEVYSQQIAFNCLPHIGSFGEGGDCSEETKIVNETRKILEEPGMRITATTVRVPVMRCHSEAVNIETEQPLKPNEARALLSGMPGVIAFDDPVRKICPVPLE